MFPLKIGILYQPENSINLNWNWKYSCIIQLTLSPISKKRMLESLTLSIFTFSTYSVYKFFWLHLWLKHIIRHDIYTCDMRVNFYTPFVGRICGCDVLGVMWEHKKYKASQFERKCNPNFFNLEQKFVVNTFYDN